MPRKDVPKTDTITVDQFIDIMPDNRGEEIKKALREIKMKEHLKKSKKR